MLNINVLDLKEDPRCHKICESNFYLIEVEWSAVGRMSSTAGEKAVWTMIASRDMDQHQLTSAISLKKNLTSHEQR